MTARRHASARDEIAIIALACGSTIAAAAHQSGHSERTLRRRLSNVDFVARVEHARAEIVARVAGRLTEAAEDAVATLRDLLEARHAAGVRLRAASVILTQAARYREQEDLEVRITDLERRAR